MERNPQQRGAIAFFICFHSSLFSADSDEVHVWLERNSEVITESIFVEERVMVRWDHFVNGDKAWYSWGFVRESPTKHFLGSVTGNTPATGRFEWSVPPRLCGKHVQIEMCSGSPPRRTKHACHTSAPFVVEGNCVAEVPVQTTSTTTEAAALREMGPLGLGARSRSWKIGGDVDQKLSLQTTGVRNGGYSVALVVVWLGPLPTYVKAFVESARNSGPSFLIFHTHDDAPSHLKTGTSSVHFHYMPLTELADRLWNVDALRKHFNLPFDAFAQKVRECYADDNPAKGNDLKVIYGALFQKELNGFTHWGWTDLDMIWGQVGSFLEPLLPIYDVISAPDGQRPALYLSGQLTVFRNNELWRRFVTGCVTGPGYVNYGGCYLESFLSEANVFFDEKVAIWYAALRGAHIFVDFSLVLSDARWQRLSAHRKPSLYRDDGHLVVPHDSSVLPFLDIEQRNSEVHLLQNVSNCFSEFGEGWSFVCIPFDTHAMNDAFGASYEVNQKRLFLWPSPLRPVDRGSEFAAFHLHRSKASFKMHWENCGPSENNWHCYKNNGIVCACELASTFSKGFNPIPNIVHFVLTDRDTRFFDWPCYVAIRSAWEKLRPEKLLVHVLDGIEPNTSAAWWQAAKRFVSDVLPFPRSEVPLSLNGVKITHPAFIADFRRIQILYSWGGIYMDTDALSLQSFDALRHWKAVLGRQGGDELRATVGLMMFEKHSVLLDTLLDRMKRAYTGAWGLHAGSLGVFSDGRATSDGVG
ncbi:unnamed protein product [Durusdinium trenchii]|uniref:Uncharacterized protein n=1 Tax=Durusdinium trenchii TaxID=1381693 RepID=A0ABP0IJ24_9DINO